jgi:hypothetical protein
MYTPAVTIVAAWIRAETGVGPAIASGSQTYRGTCADFPQAPTKRQRHTRVRYGAKREGSAAAEVKTFPKSSVPNSAKTPKIPRTKPKSPIRLTTNAFFPASAAESFL